MTSDSQDSSNSPFGIPGAGNLQSIMESMQKAWGFAAVQPVAPTLDIDEIDRRLADLNTVSQWLALNQNMLQSTIQALQVQRATLTAIQSFGMMPQTGQSAEPDSGNSPLDLMQTFARSFASATPESAAAPEAAAAPPPAAAPEAAAPPVMPAGAANPASSGFDPQQWWDMLQDQFARVASSALETPSPAPAPPAAKRRSPAAGTRKKSAAKKPAAATKPKKTTRER